MDKNQEEGAAWELLEAVSLWAVLELLRNINHQMCRTGVREIQREFGSKVINKEFHSGKTREKMKGLVCYLCVYNPIVAMWAGQWDGARWHNGGKHSADYMGWMALLHTIINPLFCSNIPIGERCLNLVFWLMMTIWRARGKAHYGRSSHSSGHCISGKRSQFRSSNRKSKVLLQREAPWILKRYQMLRKQTISLSHRSFKLSPLWV